MSTVTVGQCDYTAFGTVKTQTGSDLCRFKFSSKEHDPSTGFSYYGYRFLSPRWQRWMNRDPIGEKGGINLFGFLGNNPIVRTDALGMWYDSITAYFRACAELHVLGSDKYCECVCAPITVPDSAKECKDKCSKCSSLLGKASKAKPDSHSFCLCVCMLANQAAAKSGMPTVDCGETCKSCKKK